jgi:hypothetical protein
MFVNDQMGQDLYLGQAIPRYWLSKGSKVGIERAPSHFGVLSFDLEANAGGDMIKAVVDPPERNSPKNIFVRVRHPKERQIKSVRSMDSPMSVDANKNGSSPERSKAAADRGLILIPIPRRAGRLDLSFSHSRRLSRLEDRPMCLSM